jgi:O-antigen/teichoic acid export membrane protein
MKNIKPLSLRVNFSWALLGNLIYNACLWGILSAFNKIEGPGPTGLFILGFTIAIPITQFCALQLRGVYISDVRNDYSFRDYLGARTIWNLIALFVIVLFSFFYWPDQEAIFVIILMGIATNIQLTSDIFAAFFQKQGRQDILAKSMIFKGILNLVGVVLFFWITRSVILAVAILAFTRFLVIVLYDRVCSARFLGMIKSDECKYDWKNVQPEFSIKRIYEISIIGLPLGLAMLMISLAPQIPRFFLSRYTDLATLGIFGSIAYIMTAANMMLTSLGMTLSPRMARSYAKGNKKDFVKLLKFSYLLFTGVGIVCLAVVYFWGETILVILYSRDYIVYKNIFVLLTLASVISFFTSISGYALTAARYFKVQPYISLGNCIVVLLLSWLFIPYHGIMGAAWAVLFPSFLNMTAFFVILGIAIKKCGVVSFEQSEKFY